MTISLENQKDSLMERLDRLTQTMRLAILVSIFWPIFSLIYIWQPRRPFIFLAFVRKFVLMGVLPLVISWGIWWVAQGLRKGKTQN